MALLNLLQLLEADDQQTFTSKCNYNFDLILSLGGGPLGPQGIQGLQGVPGPQGITGPMGTPGTNGNYWFIQPSSVIPAVPVPKLNDLWLQTDTNEIFQFLGSPGTWTLVGTLTSTGVFESAGLNNLVFSQPNSTRSLVLSDINYGAGNDSPGAPTYKLKLVGGAGSPLMMFGVDDGGIENNQSFQPWIGVQKTSPTQWDWIFNNTAGNISFDLDGNFLEIHEQVTGVSRFDFGSQVQLNSNAANRILSFAFGSSFTEFFHIGRHTAISNNPDKLFSLSDQGTVGLGDAFDNLVTGDSTPSSGFLMDERNPMLSLTGNAVNNWHRFRGAVDGTNSGELGFYNTRTFTEGGSGSRSSNIIIGNSFNNTLAGFMNFTGGAAGSANGFRPQIRMGNGGTVTAPNSNFSLDINGNIGIGSPSFIAAYNDSTSPLYQYATSLSVLSKNQVSNNAYANTYYAGALFHGASQGGLHLYVPQTSYNGIPSSDLASDIVGITTGNFNLSPDQNFASAGLMFQHQGGGTNLFLATSTNTLQNTRTAIRYDGLQWMGTGATPGSIGWTSPSGPFIPISTPETWTESGFVFSPTFQDRPPQIFGAGGSKGISFLTQNPTWQTAYPGLYNHFTFDSGFGVGMELIHYNWNYSPGFAGSSGSLRNPAFIITADTQVEGILPSHTRGTSFLIDGFGNTAMGGDMLPILVPTGPNLQWSSLIPRPSLSLRQLGSIVMDSSGMPGIGLWSAGSTPHIIGADFTASAVTTLHNVYGPSMIMNPGNLRNLHVGSTANGGDLYLRGGRGEDSTGTASFYGNTVLGYDIDRVGSPSASNYFGQVLVGIGTPIDGTAALEVGVPSPFSASISAAGDIVTAGKFISNHVGLFGLYMSSSGAFIGGGIEVTGPVALANTAQTTLGPITINSGAAGNIIGTALGTDAIINLMANNNSINTVEVDIKDLTTGVILAVFKYPHSLPGGFISNATVYLPGNHTLGYTSPAGTGQLVLTGAITKLG